MVLVIGCWFGEPNVEFRISHKVINYMRDQIIKEILKPEGIFDENDPDYVGIQISTKKEVKDAYLSEPTFDKKNNFTNFYFWLPYHQIVDSKNELMTFLKYFFQVLTDFLKRYNISFNEIEKLRKKIENEVLGNDEYQYQPPESDIDEVLSDLGID